MTRNETRPPASAEKGGALICTLCAPWPTRPIQGIYNLDWAKALRGHGVRTAIYSPSPSIPRWFLRMAHRKDHADRPERYEIDGVDFHAPRVPFLLTRDGRKGRRLGQPSWVMRWMETAVASSLDRAIEEQQPEVLIGHGAHPWARVLVNAGRRHGVRVYFVEHSHSDLVGAEESARLSEVHTYAAENADGLFTVSHPMADLLEKVNGGRRPHVVVQGATRVPDPGQRPDELEGRLVVLAASHYYRRKRLEELVEAFSEVGPRFPHATLIVATDPPPLLRKMIELSDADIRLHAPLPHDYLLRWMGWADLFALPSWKEAFGLVYAESLMAGTPVIVGEDAGVARHLDLRRPSNIDALKDDAPLRDGWAVPTRGVRPLVAAFEEALMSPYALRFAGAEARARATRTFCWRGLGLEVAKAIGLKEPFVRRGEVVDDVAPPAPLPASETDARVA